MNKLFLILVFATQISKAQCNLDFEELRPIKEMSFSEFETFALKNGYSYNTKNRNFMCDDYLGDDKGHVQLFWIDNKGELPNVQFLFYSKNTYLEFKTFLEKSGKFLDIIKKEGELSYVYKYENMMVLLSTVTENNINFYMIMF